MVTPENSKKSIQITLNAPGNTPNRAPLCANVWNDAFPVWGPPGRGTLATQSQGRQVPQIISTVAFSIFTTNPLRSTPSPPHYSPRGPSGRVQKILTEAWSSQQPMTWSKKMGRMNLEMMLKQLLKRCVKLYSWQSYSYATAYFSVSLTFDLFRQYRVQQ